MQTFAALTENTERFYEWELRGRGWQTFPHLVPLEPPFRPFYGHRLPPTRLVDDGRRQTLLSSLWARASGKRAGSISGVDEADHLAPIAIDTPQEQVVEIELLVPHDQKIDPVAGEALLRAISGASGRVAFEVVGAGRRVVVQMSCGVEDASLIQHQLRAFIPSVVLRVPEFDLRTRWMEAPGTTQAIEFGLAREFMLPLRELPKVPDPLTAFIGALAQVGSGELGLLQVLFEPVQAPWAAHATRAVTSPDGEPFFVDAPELTTFAETKFASPLYAASVRVLATAETEQRANEVMWSVASALSQYTDPDRNGFVPLASEDIDALTSFILLRCGNRSGMLLSLSELAGLVRLPGDQVRSSALLRVPEPVERLPAEVLGQSGVVIGNAKHERSVATVRLSAEARTQHTYVIGASGTGKSTLIEQMILQDIAAGEGVGVLDPHGDLVDEILARIPEARLADVVLFDPSDTDAIVGWNILGAHSALEKDLLASDLVAVFQRLSTSWGDQMSAVLGNAVLAFLESHRGGTLIDLRKFLLDESFRTEFLTTVDDDHVVSFWRDEFSLLASKKPQAPILTRLDIFLRSRLVREAVTECEVPLNFRGIIDSGKIFLARLSQGTIGEENAALLGSLLVSKFHQVSLSRQNIAIEARRPFYLYLDEFQQMATPSMAGLFSGVRKYRLCLTVAHQDLYQLHRTAPEVERSALANAYTRMVFRVSDEDARKLERGMGDFGAEDLANLARGEVVCRVGKKDDAFKMMTIPIPDLAPAIAERNREQVRRASVARYGRPRTGPAPKRPEAIPAPAPTPPPGVRRAVVPVVPEPPSPPERPERPPDPTPGRGGPVHKYLQGLIKEAANAHGFRAEIEQDLPSGGRVDVSLSRESLTIACEIAGTTTVERELGNIEKCLAAGFDYVAAVSVDGAFLKRLAKAIPERIPESHRGRVHVFSPEELMAFLSVHKSGTPQAKVAGYSVTVRRKADAAGADDRRRTIADVMMKSIKRMREKA